MTTLYKYIVDGRPVQWVDEKDEHTPDAVRQAWTQTFPELGNATASEEKPKEAGKKLTVTVEGVSWEVDRVVTFAKKVGTKGHCGHCHTVLPPRWVSVAERLPEEGDKVLVWKDGYIYMSLWRVRGWWSLPDYHLFEEGSVKFWMPLPPPPEAQS